LGYDHEKKVREACNETQNVVVTVVKKKLAPFLKQIIGNGILLNPVLIAHEGVWLCNMFDPYSDVAQAAKTALNVNCSDSSI
jgi:hypothetical protein